MHKILKIISKETVWLILEQLSQNNQTPTDLAKNFIKAIDCKTSRAVGKEYKVKHRDGLEIITR